MNGLGRLIQHATTQVRLTREGVEVAAPVPVLSWQEDGDTLATKVRFGPYASRVVADSIVVNVDGVDDEIRFSESLTIPAGVSFLYGLRVTVTTG